MDKGKKKGTIEKKINNSEESSDLEKLHKKLKEEEDNLNKQIEELEKQGLDCNLKPQMEALHLYNQTRDITQVVLGYIADIKHTNVTELHKQFNLPTETD